MKGSTLQARRQPAMWSPTGRTRGTLGPRPMWGDIPPTRSLSQRGPTAKGRGPMAGSRSKNRRQTEVFLRHSVRRIVSAFPRVRKIVLFGSYAGGHPTPNSDVDLFIVMPTRRRWGDRVRMLNAIFPERPVPVDFIVRTPREVRERLTSYFCPFTREVLSKGRVLYEAPPRRS